MLGGEGAPSILSEEQLETIDGTAMRICEEIGLDVLHEGARRSSPTRV